MKHLAIFLIAISLTGSLFSADWGYDPPEVLPEQWGTLPGYELCGSGKAQSPVDFSQSKLDLSRRKVRTVRLPNLELSYHDTPLHIINKGHTIEMEYESGSELRLVKNGPSYEILQFHFHAPSEHSFEKGALFDVEMHIVHQNVDADPPLAVVGVMIREGQENSVLKPLIDNLSKIKKSGDEFVDSQIHINIRGALPKDRRYFAYRGSLTTPPCSETVAWRVLRQPIEMSRNQIHALVSLLDDLCCEINGNNRPVQPLNGRTIQLDRTRQR